MAEFLNLYGQSIPHSDATIRGTPETLKALANAILTATQTSNATLKTYASDGEGYSIKIEATTNDEQPTPYYDENYQVTPE
jgi:hypothetical protein